MSTVANNVKTAINTQLQALVTSGTLAAVIMEDLSKNVLELDFPAFPCAVLGMAGVGSRYESQQMNLRTYRFDVLIVQKYENLTSPTDIEDLADKILTQFDNNFTLLGAAQLGVEAMATPAAPVSSNDKTYVVFNVTIKANALQPLTYNF